MAGEAGRFEPYVPRVATEWDDHAQGSFHRTVDGTLLFVDISGFTNLSERLARRGRIGAEELTLVLNRVFGNMLDLAYARGGSLLKFGGDALLLLFDSEDSVMQATASAVEMRAALREASKEKTSVGRIDLKMSSGIHAGEIDFFLVGESHRELLVTGPVASTTTAMEGSADAGEIVVSQAVKDRLPPSFIGDTKGSGWLVRKRKIHHPDVGAVSRQLEADLNLNAFLPDRLRDHIAAGITESEHRLATIGFLKFKGVDALLETNGPAEVGSALHDLVTITQRASDAEGVTFLSSDIDADGGKIILATGIPTSQHDDEGRLLRTSRSVLDADLALDVRLGINRGHVFAGDVGTAFRRTFTVMGDTVNLAARLMAAAPTSGAYVSPGVLDGSSTLFRTEAVEPFNVKGKEKPVHAYRVFEEIGTRPPESSHELPFHGREPELEMIVSIVTTCARVGRGGMMSISGETGIGKSRLIAEVLERCPGLATFTVKAEPNGAENPYWAFRDPLRSALGIRRSDARSMAQSLQAAVGSIDPDLLAMAPLIANVVHVEMDDNATTSAIDPRFRPDRTADVLIEVLERIHNEPIAFVAEDAQWLDQASRALILRLGQAAETRPWSVVATMRDLAGSEADLLGDEVALRALDDASIRQIAIEATAGAPLLPHELDGIVSRVGGNPLFLAEILAAIRDVGGADEIPETLDAVVSTQIDTLPSLARQTLRYSSVLGTSFPTVVLEELLAPDGIELDAATKSELSRFMEKDTNDRWRFRHAVVHDVAYHGLSYRRRRELHGRAAEVVETMAGDDVSASAEFLAYHYSEAGRFDKAWSFSQVAADRARAAYANTEAATHLERALEAARHLDDIEDEEVAQSWIQLGEVRELAGQMDHAREALTQALRLVDPHTNQRSDIFVRRAATWLSSGDLRQAKRNVSLGRKELNPSLSASHLGRAAQLDAFEASIHFAADNPTKAAEAARLAIEKALQVHQEEALARAYSVLDWANFMLGVAEDRKGPDAIEIYQRLGQLERSVNVMNNLGAFSYLEGDWDEAVRWYAASLEAAEKSGNVLDAALARTNIAEVFVGQARYDDAIEMLEMARRVYDASKASHFVPLVRLLMARARLGLGEYDLAIRELQALLAEQLNGRETAWTGETAVALADALLRIGRRREASELVGEIVANSWATSTSVTRLTAQLDDDQDNSRRLLTSAASLAAESGETYEELLALELLWGIAQQTGGSVGATEGERLQSIRSKLGVTTPLDAGPSHPADL